MEKITVCVLLMVMLSEAFFLRNRDLKKILRFLPGNEHSGEEHHHRHNPHHHHRHRHHETIPENAHHHDYNHHHHHDKNDHYSNNEDDYNPYDKRGSSSRYDQNYHRPNYNNKINNHHHNCPEHHREDKNYYYTKFTEQSQPNRNKNRFDYSEEVSDYDEGKPNYQRNDRKNYYYMKAQLPAPVTERQPDNVNYNKYYDRQPQFNYKKDYVTGVLVTIPKIKNDEDTHNYYREAKQHNLFFQNLFKTEDDHHPAEGVVKSYIY